MENINSMRKMTGRISRITHSNSNKNKRITTETKPVAIKNFFQIL
jgi:hypothetical protein